MTVTDVRTSDIELLASIRLFASASDAELRELVSNLKRRSYPKGEVIYHQDDPPGALYVVVRGTVKMQVTSPEGKQMTIGWQSRGQFFGTIGIVGYNVRPEDAIALEPCEVLVIDREDARTFLHRHPEALETLMEVLAQRWRHAIELICDLAFLDVPARVAKILLNFSRSRGEAEADGSIVIRHMTQPELASLVGATRESVHNSLTSFARQGLIECQRGSIRVLQPEGLRQRLG